MKPSKEEFERWRAGPVTEWVMARLLMGVDDMKRQWVATSWEGGVADGARLMALRERASVYREVTTITFEELAALGAVHDGDDA